LLLYINKSEWGSKGTPLSGAPLSGATEEQALILPLSGTGQNAEERSSLEMSKAIFLIESDIDRYVMLDKKKNYCLSEMEKVL